MARLEGLTLPNSLVGLNTLLTKANGLNLVAFFSHNNMAFCRVARCAFGFVIAAYFGACYAGVLGTTFHL